MRITHSMLIKNTHAFVDAQVRKDHGLVCVYLTGSMLTEEELLGGAADIDLIFVHTYPVSPDREIMRLTNEIHFDVRHRSQQEYSDPKHLRHDAWLGSSIWQKPLVLHEKNHWFDFVLAGVYAQFTRPENIFHRVLPFIERARAEWMQLNMNTPLSHTSFLNKYLQIIEDASNAVALLNGTPLTIRRFLQQFPERASKIGQPELTAKLINLYAYHLPDEQTWKSWLNAWKIDYQLQAQRPDCNPDWHPLKEQYYQLAMETLQDEMPAAALWILLKSWSAAASRLENDAFPQPQWNEMQKHLGLSPDTVENRIQEADQYLDSIEEIIDHWAESEGLLETD